MSPPKSEPIMLNAPERSAIIPWSGAVAGPGVSVPSLQALRIGAVLRRARAGSGFAIRFDKIADDFLPRNLLDGRSSNLPVRFQSHNQRLRLIVDLDLVLAPGRLDRIVVAALHHLAAAANVDTAVAECEVQAAGGVVDAEHDQAAADAGAGHRTRG